MHDNVALRKTLLARTQKGKTVYHFIAESDSLEILEYVDNVVEIYFSKEREILLQDTDHSPLSEATSFKMFMALLKLGATDPKGEYVNYIFDELTQEQQEELYEFYLERSWETDFFIPEFTPMLK